MILPTLLSCLVIMVSAAPTNVPSSVVTRGEATQGPSQKPDLQTPAAPTPDVRLLNPNSGFHLLSPTEQFLWSPVGGTPMLILLQQLISLPVSDPLLSSPFINQLDSKLSSFSSEEFEVNIYLSTALIDPSAATIQPANQAAGLQHLVPTVGNLSAGAQQPPVTSTSGRPVDTTRVPAGTGTAAEEASNIH